MKGSAVMKKCLFFFFAFIILFPVFIYAEERIRVTFINPGFSNADNPTGGFWLSVSSFMNAAAEDLSIDLEILYSDRNHIKMQRHAKEVSSRKNPPDYLIVVNEKRSAESMVIDADQAGIKVFVMLNRFEGKQSIRMGQPRGKYKNWIGSLIPDNYYAGYKIAKLLIEDSLKAGVKAPDSLLHLLAYSGDDVTLASVERVKGLRQAVSEYPDVDLKQIISCSWSKDLAKKKTPKLLKRYPHIGAIWGANDPIAIGAMEAAVDAGKTPGKDIFFGGLNWDTPGLEKIQSKEMVTSLGGHFMTGGWVLVLLYDFHHGKDFASEGLQLQYKIFEAIHGQNIDHFLTTYGDRNWKKIDFTKFTKTLNQANLQYEFNLESILKQ